MSNIVEVMPRVGVVAKTKPLWQYDSGQIIRVTGITLPATYKAEFSKNYANTNPVRVMTTVTLEMASGEQILKESIGGLPVPEPEPEVTPDE